MRAGIAESSVAASREETKESGGATSVGTASVAGLAIEGKVDLNRIESLGYSVGLRVGILSLHKDWRSF